MFERFLQATKCLQPFWSPLVIACSFSLASTLHAQEALPPLFIDPSAEAQLSIKQTQNDSSETLRPILEPTATQIPDQSEIIEEIISEPKELENKNTDIEGKIQINTASSNVEFIPTPKEFVSDTSTSTTETLFTPLTSPSQDDELQTLWEKTFPPKQIPPVAPPPLKQDPVDAVPLKQKPLDIVEQKTPTDTATDETQEEIVEAEPEVVPKERLPAISIIIDDLGYNKRGMQSSLKLPVEVTLAILPSTPFATKTAVASTKQSRTIMLHAPMENTRRLELGPGGLYTTMEEDEFKRILTQSISGIPGITGVNNHMGSLLTQDTKRMQWVMEVLQPLELFFVDSVTSGQSVAYKEAQAMSITSVKRNVFLDNLQTEAAIHKQFERLLKIAKKDGSALAIGHPYPSTMSYLLQRLPQLEKDGIKLISIDEYIKRKQSQN